MLCVLLSLQVFFACTCATLALNLSKSAVAAMVGRGIFGWFEKELAFEVRCCIGQCIPQRRKGFWVFVVVFLLFYLVTSVARQVVARALRRLCGGGTSLPHYVHVYG
jgi:hypothetical protein